MKEQTMQQRWENSFLAGGGDSYLEALYETYLKNPNDVSEEWREYFATFGANSTDVSHQEIRDFFQNLARQSGQKVVVAQGGDLFHERKREKVLDLIFAYRRLGHLQADIDPLGLYTGIDNPELELSFYGFTDADLDTVFEIDSFIGVKQKSTTLREIYNALRKTYCSTIGIEYMHINSTEEVEWLQQRMEQVWPYFSPTREEKLRILDRLVVADGLEKYLGFKYVGQKRFALEGGDSFIPMLDTIVNHGTDAGIKEIIIGMAHRGRLNVLVNILGKEPKDVFAGFEGKVPEGGGVEYSGDVKYHMGYSADIKTVGQGIVHLALAFNPSHLEIVAPVVQGSVRARQRRRKDTERRLVMPVQVHGDAAFSGQGVVAETFNMSQARWFTVGGSIHIVINNQIGFTISNPQDARSTLYCTDISKMVQPPVFHINADDPEAVYFASLLAVDFHTRFKKDIVLDLVCYRRHGHNEADEPSATQPIMYKVIKSLPPTCTLYAKKLVEEGVIDVDKEKSIADAYRKLLDEGKAVVDTVQDKAVYEYSVAWQPFIGTKWTTPANTAVPMKKLTALAKQLEVLPEGFVLQAQVKKMMETRQKMTAGETPLNWGYAEILAYATLLDDGYPIRICGQDVARGTFAHRHAILHEQNTDSMYIPLSNIKPGQVQINIVDSLLSEEAVLAFEYGYASADPNYLVIWEAQFGDFANGAQVVFDQFISSGEQKWRRLCGLTVFLPHGFEGGGPEHSSARLERYLQLCAQDNMQVCVPTTPAQDFHMLRRQMVRPYRKPLIVMTPKSLLRHPLAVSTLEDLSKGGFQNVIPEIDAIKAQQVETVIFCCGKVYYDLLEKRRELKLNTNALVRIEQLYPFPNEDVEKVLKQYANAKDIVWCQEEPANQGAWFMMRNFIQDCMGKGQKLRYAGRTMAASPSTGYPSVHLREQEALVKEALSIK
ncbi:MAG: 2-oxoglutarate dehydrogenase E1 component [Pseudomonadota bacterium]